ncbi:F0F1 ATP synthase subunit B' [Falsirhodobacter deserti]|uniref:F0F1 ATP synthase subunit B' n=1 Tax=Falsirhodobacter deserti TaxID=1365611 RepID=UPI000FE3E44E|nr:F0F1 ATP synthase subunit B' [Falsirhodobacter deserti]
MEHQVQDVAEAATGHAPHAGGMPQLDFTSWPNQIFWLLVALVAIYLLLTRVALPRIGAVLAERRGAITNDLLAAEELKQKARDAETAYNDALVRARAEAQAIVAKAKEAIDADLAAAVEKADAEIAQRVAVSEARINQIRAGMQDSVREVASETATALVAALGGQPDASVQSAVADRVKG